jgi:formiminotetrahydrofolate cyclodeaminase
MTQDGDLSRVTLDDFRLEAASERAMPAGVAIAAVSAGFALALAAKVLGVSSRQSPLHAQASRIEPLAAAAQTASQHMLQLAGDDVTAFGAYLTARRLPHSTEAETQARQQAIDSAIRRTVDVPLAAAHQAAAGLRLCGELSSFTPPALVADLGVIASLLASALRGFLLCAESNVRNLAPGAASLGERVATEAQRHAPAFGIADAVLERTRAALESVGIPRSET